MRRRDFITVLGGSIATWPIGANAQQVRRMRRVGILLFSKQDRANVDPFVKGLEALGYVDGKTVAIEYHDADGKGDRLAVAASELAALDLDLIFAFGGDVAPFLKKATATIPIVVVVSNDPVESGLVPSLGRPGGNLTGLTYVHDMLAGKSVELLKDTLPSISRVAILWNPDHADPEFRETQRASRTLDVKLQSLEVRKAEDFEDAFKAAEKGQPEAVIIIGGRFVFLHRQKIADFANKNRIIVAGVPSWLLDLGALMSYGPNVPELLRRAAAYADKILKGARPSDLPMLQPTTFELIVSLKRAKELGISVPPTVIARADRVIE